MHTINNFALEILREVLLLSLCFGSFVELLDDIEVLHFRPFHSSNIV